MVARSFLSSSIIRWPARNGFDEEAFARPGTGPPQNQEDAADLFPWVSVSNIPNPQPFIQLNDGRAENFTI
jgi:hypothetical protein